MDRLRAAGIRVGIVTNQSGIAHGTLTRADVDRINARVAELVGPIDTIAVCEHNAASRCRCRKPQPGLIFQAAAALGVAAADCAVVGDIAADVDAARAAGALAILVPTPITLRHEITVTASVVADLATAVDVLIGAT